MIARTMSVTRRWIGALSPAGGDALLYAAAAVFAALTLVISSIPLYRQWAQLSVIPYVAGAVGSLLIARYRRLGRQRRDDGNTKGAAASFKSNRLPAALVWIRSARAWMFVGVLIGATLLPLSLEVMWRSEGNPSLHVQPEVVVVERAAHRAANHQDPYQVVVRDGRVVASLPGLPKYETFYPYLPLMTVFGLPSSTKAPIKLTDARIFFSLVTLAVTAAALCICRSNRERKVRTLQVLSVLPTAALPLATGGDDMPVVALLLLAIVLAQRRRPGWSGIVFGVVAAMKFTAWPLAGLALFAARDKDGRRTPIRMGVGIACVLGPILVPFVVGAPRAFFENVVLYPLGLAGVSSPAASPLPGHLLVSALPFLHRPLTVVVIGLGGALLLVRLVRHTPTSVSQCSYLAGWVMTAAILLAPATRFGYLLYPVNFFMWGYLLSEDANKVGQDTSRLSAELAYP